MADPDRGGGPEWAVDPGILPGAGGNGGVVLRVAAAPDRDNRGGRTARRARAAMTGATFALVHEAAITPEPAGVELVWADGRRLRIGPGVDATTLRTVLAVLEPERC